jgi:acyl-CoA dehydrogenase
MTERNMVDFTLSDNDKDILESVAAEAKAGEKYARYYYEHEDEVLPKAFPEARAFPSLL